jgi:uncharacterized protein YacL
MALVLLAKHLEGCHERLQPQQSGEAHNVGVINLNDIANSLKPLFLPGEEIECGS